MRPRKPIQGYQVHHSVFLSDAMRGATNACAGINSARVRRPDDPVLESLEHRARALAREISQVQDEASQRLRSLPLDVVKRCRDGEAPWPDEPAPGFVGRCSCYGRCLTHATGVGRPEDCNCGKVCPAHGEIDG